MMPDYLSNYVDYLDYLSYSTDDSGVFGTNLTFEYIAVIKAFHLTLQQAVYLAAQVHPLYIHIPFIQTIAHPLYASYHITLNPFTHPLHSPSLPPQTSFPT